MASNWRICKAPHHVTFFICLALYIVALLSYFGILHLGHEIGTYSWIVGFLLLLLSVRIRGL